MSTDLTQYTISNRISGATATVDFQIYNQVDNCYILWNGWWETYHYYCYPETIYAKDKTSKAFRIVKSLMDKKVIELKNIKEFIDTVDVIVMEL
jgi:hypothetical protein